MSETKAIAAGLQRVNAALESRSATLERRNAELTKRVEAARVALMASRVAMSITPAIDTMPGYLAELHKGYIMPTLGKVDAALSQLNQPLP